MPHDWFNVTSITDAAAGEEAWLCGACGQCVRTEADVDPEGACTGRPEDTGHVEGGP